MSIHAASSSSAHQQTPKPCFPPHEPLLTRVASPSAHDAASSKGQQLQVPRLHDDRILRRQQYHPPIAAVALTVPVYMHAAIISIHRPSQSALPGATDGVRFRRAGADAKVQTLCRLSCAMAEGQVGPHGPPYTPRLNAYALRRSRVSSCLTAVATPLGCHAERSSGPHGHTSYLLLLMLSVCASTRQYAQGM